MMALIEYYPLLRAAHIGLVLSSGMLFLLRGLAVLSGRSWGMAPQVRHLSYGLDTLLLLAGLCLWWLLGLNPLLDHWLGTKLGLLLLYIVLGSLALKRARSRAGCWMSFFGALVVFLYMLSVARQHHPAGIFSTLD